MSLVSLSLIILLCEAGIAQAEIVRLKVGENSWGQGWMFLDNDGRCKVVTAGHVVINAPHAEILDGRKRSFPAGLPEVLSRDPNPDIAVLPVPRAGDISSCGDGRLSTIGIERRVRDMTTGIIETTGETETIRVRVRRSASHIDVAQGEIFSVVPVDAVAVKKGWSGSVVEDDNGPLGIVVSVDPKNNEVAAIRVDVVRRLIDQASAGPMTDRLRIGSVKHAYDNGPTERAITVLSGSTIDPVHGADQLLSAGGSSWHVTPVGRKVVFVISYRQPVQIRHVRLAFNAESLQSIKGVDVAVSDSLESETWGSLNYCRMPDDHAMIECPVIPSTVTNIRISLNTKNDERIAVLSLNF
jgi:hypothetical protein